MNEERYAVEVARWYETEDDIIADVVESGFNYNRASVLDTFEVYGLDPIVDITSAAGHYGSAEQGVTINVYKLGEF